MNSVKQSSIKSHRSISLLKCKFPSSNDKFSAPTVSQMVGFYYVSIVTAYTQGLEWQTLYELHLVMKKRADIYTPDYCYSEDFW